jgi:LuxR family quorum sensing-dependent transcriptional regulator
VANGRLARAFGLIERCVAGEDAEPLTAAFLEIVALFGFNTAACGGSVGVGAGRSERFYFNSWPRDWLDVYIERGLMASDPIVHQARSRTTPFVWGEIEPRIARAAGAGEVLSLARQHGWTDGLVVPAHGPGGYIGLISMAAPARLALDATDRACLWALGLAIHERCRASPGVGISQGPVPKLTARERECMAWVAAGKTEWEIGRLLGIAQSTVHFHVGRVKARLGTSRRTSAVALLVLHGLL